MYILVRLAPELITDVKVLCFAMGPAKVVSYFWLSIKSFLFVQVNPFLVFL